MANPYQCIETRGRRLPYLLLIILELKFECFPQDNCIEISTPLPYSSSSFRTNHIPYYLLQLLLVIGSFPVQNSCCCSFHFCLVLILKAVFHWKSTLPHIKFLFLFSHFRNTNYLNLWSWSCRPNKYRNTLVQLKE